MTLYITRHGHGRPLVLLHGWGFDSHIWQPLVSVLNARGEGHPGYQLYLVDLPGFGRSPVMDWNEFKAALLTQLPETFALVGWSMGGLFATRLLIEEPARITHLLNIASSPRFIQDIDWPGVEPPVFTAFYESVVHDPEQTLKQFIGLQLKGHVDLSTINLQRVASMGLHAGLDVLVNWDLRDALFGINKPVCYLFGRLDTITPRTLFMCMQKKYPHFDYKLFSRAAHTPFLSHPMECIHLMDNFLS